MGRWGVLSAEHSAPAAGARESEPGKRCRTEGEVQRAMTVEAQSSDVQTLHQLGYAQELLRRMSGFSNFAVSFTIISILSGCLTLYGYGRNPGGPIAINLGWPLVGIMVTLVGLAMAEVCSSYPTAGGLYYWSAKLADKNGPAWSWFTGWVNLLGQIGGTARHRLLARRFLHA